MDSFASLLSFFLLHNKIQHACLENCVKINFYHNLLDSKWVSDKRKLDCPSNIYQNYDVKHT